MLFYYGVYLYESSNNTISKNNITQNIYGIWLDYSLNNAISGNNVKDNDYGIYLHESSNNIISGNNMTDNGAGIYLNWSSNNIISGNNMTINQGSIWLSGSSNNTMSGNNATKSMVGIGLGEFSNNNSVSGNNITDNGVGITLASESSNNSISGNDIENNGDGIWLSNSSNNKFYHNNFVDNTQHVYIKKSGYANFWDNDVEGNYWSNYTGVDSDHDGIGDSPHVLDGNKTDNHPLMGMFHSFNTSLGCYVNVVSNSTIEDFDYFESNSTIRTHVSNSSETQSFGFCRVCISKGLMSLPYTIIIDDGLTEVLYFNDTVHYNITHIWIYFAYEHSTHKVEIIPEFPTWTSMLLILIVLTVAIAICKRRLLKTQIH